MQQDKATLHDLPDIVALLLDDELGKTRERMTNKLDQR